MKKWKIYALFIILTFAVGGLAAVLTMNSMDIYSRIVQPMFAPPSWIFPVAWGILYLLMAIGAARVCIKTDEIPMIYVYQLAVNFLWPIIFFRMEAFLFAFIWLVLLLILVVIMTLRFYKVDKAAGLLQIPYILWLLFAGYLNLAIYFLNM